MTESKSFQITLEIMGRSKDGEGWTMEVDDIAILDSYDEDFDSIEEAIEFAIKTFPQLKATKDDTEKVHECEVRIMASNDSKLYDDAEELSSESVGYAYCEINEFILENEGTAMERKLYCNNGEWS